MKDLKLQLEQLINKNVEGRLFPACAISAITPTEELVVRGGTYTYEERRQIKSDSVFDAASITKVLPTSCSALKLLQEKKLKLDDDIRQYLPDYKNALTIWNLLTQTVYYDFGFPLSSLSHKSPDKILKAIFECPIRTFRDEYHYTNSSSILLGLVVEKASGKNLAELGRDFFFEPLSMTRTGFDPLSLAAKDEIVPTEIGTDGLALHAAVHDESARAFKTRPVGSAGLFTTARDLSKFTKMILFGGSLNSQMIFFPETIAMMSENQLEGDGCVGLGWELNQPRYMGKYSKGTFGKTGFTGCVMLVNLELGSAVVILSNHIHPKRPDSFGPINRFRSSVADLVFGSAAS